MSDWLTYSPEDLLMFSERTYRRLFETHNAALWPVHPAVLLAGFAIFVMLMHRGARPDRPVAATLAAAWVVVAFAWFWMRFSTIHTGGRIMAVAFAIEAAALAWFAIARSDKDPSRPSGFGGWIGCAMLAFGLILHPLVGIALGRPWTQSEVFGLAPDPTAIATLGALLLVRRAPWFLWVVPVGWCLFSGMTLWAMHTPDAWLPPVLAIAGVVLAVVRRMGERQELRGQ